MLEAELITLDKLVTLRTIKNNIDINFLHKKDLENIQDIANELKIKIANIEIEDIDESDIYEIYNIWSSQINLMCKQKRKQILDNYGD